MPPFDHFSLIAPFYDRIFRRPRADPLPGYVLPERESRMLDVGGGTGRIAQRFLGLVAQICILDPAPGMLGEGKLKGICITQGESERLPYASEAFDRIILVDAYHHLRDQEEAGRELMRVLAPGGRLVIEEPDIGHRGVKIVALLEKLLLMRSHFRAPERIQRTFAQNGNHTRISRQGATAWVIVEKPCRDP